MKRFVFIAAFVALCVSATGFAADGAALFKSKMCSACHGAGKKAIDLKESKKDKAGMMSVLMDGKTPDGKAHTKLSHEDAEAILGYLGK